MEERDAANDNVAREDCGEGEEGRLPSEPLRKTKMVLDQQLLHRELELFTAELRRRYHLPGDDRFDVRAHWVIKGTSYEGCPGDAGYTYFIKVALTSSRQPCIRVSE